MAIHSGAAANKRTGKRKSGPSGGQMSKRRRKQLARLVADQADDEHLYRKPVQDKADEGGKKDPKAAPTAGKSQKQNQPKQANKRMGFMQLADL